MRRYVLAVSLAHLALLPGYVKLGAINPWQAVGTLFGGGYLWLVMMLSAAAAPFLLGFTVWAVDAILVRQPGSWVSKVRESTFIFLSIFAFLSVGNAALLADRAIDQNVRGLFVGFVNQHLLTTMVLFAMLGLTLVITFLIYASVRRRLIWFLRPLILILSPAVLFSVVGIIYVLAVATPIERSRDVLSEGARPAPPGGSPKSVVVLLFDGLSYAVAFRDSTVDARLPHMRALTEQSIVFHNVPSFSAFTVDNGPILFTGQIYDGYRFDSQAHDAAYLPDGRLIALKDQRNIFDLAAERGYEPVVFGYFLRYCSTYVKDTGYCQSTSADELNSEPYNFIQAISEIYRLTAAKTVPTSVGYELESTVGTTFLSLIEDRVAGLQNALLRILNDAEGRFIYAHYPIPHNPYVSLDPQTGNLRSAGATYFDSLQAMDFYLGEVRQTLEDAGVWDATLLIVLADHYWPAATSDVRIPLIVKLPQSQQRMDFEGLWTHAQFLPLLDELIQDRSFDPGTVLDVVQALAPPER
jgi:hypothetical protein